MVNGSISVGEPFVKGIPCVVELQVESEGQTEEAFRVTFLL